MTKPTARAMATALRTYHRPVHEGDTLIRKLGSSCRSRCFSPAMAMGTSTGSFLNEREEDELEEMRRLIPGRYIAPAGRTFGLAEQN